MTNSLSLSEFLFLKNFLLQEVFLTAKEQNTNHR